MKKIVNLVLALKHRLKINHHGVFSFTIFVFYKYGNSLAVTSFTQRILMRLYKTVNISGGKRQKASKLCSNIAM